MRRLLTIGCAAAALAGCATRPDNISAAYVSPVTYQTYTCPQLGEEAQRVSARVAQLTGVQQDKATGDAVAMGVTLVVFWPAAFFLKGDGQTAAELARLKGESDAIEQASIARKCAITFKRV